MNKKDRISFIVQTLNQLFPNPTIPLLHSDPYTLLIATLLSAQCQDERVNRVTPALFELANTPKKMAHLKEETIYQTIASLGLAKTKAKAIKALSEILVNQFDEQVPPSLEKLETLPGVGHKTASVLLIQAFNQPAFPVDTHIHRLAKRFKLSNGTSVQQTETDLKKAFPSSLWAKIHLQLIYYGRTYCPARGHEIENCPICKAIHLKAK